MAKKEPASGGTTARQRSKPATTAGADQGGKTGRTQINLRLSPKEKADLQVLADRSGLSLTAYLIAAGFHQGGPTDETFSSPNFTEAAEQPTPDKTRHEINVKHLLSWAQILDGLGVNTAPLRDALKRHLQQAATDRLWQAETQKLGQQLVQATKLGTRTNSLQEMTDGLTRKLRQHQARG